MTLDLRCYLVTSGTDRHTVETAALAAGAEKLLTATRPDSNTVRKNPWHEKKELDMILASCVREQPLLCSNI